MVYAVTSPLPATRTPQESYSEETVRRLCRIIVSAMDHVHTADVVHRDIKPGSFVLAKPDDERSVKLTDFGAACFLEADGLVPTKVCTDKLMAPEMLKRKRHGTVRFSYEYQ